MISTSVLDAAAGIRRRFQAAVPFRHVSIDDFLAPLACESLLRDFPPFDERKALNEFGKPGRKAVHESVLGISPFYGEFYRYIGSSDFLRAMSELTGIPKLLADPALFGGGTHNNLDGQGLDVHVDFNVHEGLKAHRRLNLLIYLNKEWEEAWGGAIELHSDPWSRQSDGVTGFLPLFNRALIFETSERSWHGFQRIRLPADRKHLSRKSFSIYLYTKDRPAEEAVAPHTTFYVPTAPPVVAAGTPLSAQQADDLRRAFDHSDNLLRHYQKLLIDKEQQLQNIVNSRAWRAVTALRSAKAHVLSLFRP